MTRELTFGTNHHMHEAELIVKFNCGSTDTLLEFEGNKAYNIVQEL